MENNLFRKQSLEHISSPDELHNYIRVTGPRLWMVLVTIVVLLVGFITYATSTVIENTMPIQVELENFENDPEYQKKTGIKNSTYVAAQLPLSMLDSLEIGMKLVLGNEEGKICYISADDKKVYLSFEMENEYIPLKPGKYDAVLVLESTTAISYLFQ